MRRRPLALALGLTALVASAGWAVAAGTADERRFPHARHAGLFPTCLGCHAGVLGDTVPQYPPPQQCAGCHDGRQERTVSWNGAAPPPPFVRFSHREHNREADMGDPATNCRQCHAQAGSTAFMAVQRAVPQPCIACHGHRASAHLAPDSPCRTCHVSIAQQTQVPDSVVASLPRPPSHEGPDFMTKHGPTVEVARAQCAVCHARESCARCHLNASQVPAIAALDSDPRVARLVARTPGEYPVPPSHQRPDWPYAHGKDARQRIASCGTCHTRPSCRICHIGPLGNDAISKLPPGGAGAQGVQLRLREPAPRPRGPADREVLLTAAGAPRVVAGQGTDTLPRARAHTVRVHPPRFETAHSAAAASRQATCAGCHERRFCSDCHDGEGSRRFHPPNFVERHPSDAYRRQRDCASCHNTEAFCRTCHEGVGLRSAGRLDVAFHTAQPNWLLQHGRAARQGMESCATCHVQQDCMQCHSTIGWGVNPHGPGFDPSRMQKRNRQTCRYCHVGDPLGG